MDLQSCAVRVHTAGRLHVVFCTSTYLRGVPRLIACAARQRPSRNSSGETHAGAATYLYLHTRCEEAVCNESTTRLGTAICFQLLHQKPRTCCVTEFQERGEEASSIALACVPMAHPSQTMFIITPGVPAEYQIPFCT